MAVLPTQGEPPRAQPPAGLALADFVESPETRLRDMLAFAMAAEAGRPLPPDGIAGLRQRAEADLHANAFRMLHNQIETIRQQAVAERLANLRAGLSFPATVLAGLLAILIAAGAAYLLVAAGGTLPAQAADHVARFLAQLSERL